MVKKNEDKVKLLYDEIDNNLLFKGVVVEEDCFLMNVIFVMVEGKEELVE